MSVTLTVNNNPHEFPQTGDSPGWGDAVTGWAEDVTTVLDTLLGSSDITLTSATVLNNQSSVVNVAGLSFNTGTVRAAIIEYSIYRVSSTNPSGKAETGTISLVYDNSAGAGNKWSIAHGQIVGNAGIIFSITDAGQVQYTSTDIGSTSYSGVMKFKARTLPQ